MSRYHAIITIRRELDALNREIDLRIIRGLSYVRESRRHKFLMSQLKRLTTSVGWFAKSFNLISTFMF